MARRLGRFLIVCVLVVSLLAGCSQATQEPEAEPAPGAEAEQPKADTQKINYVLNDEASKLDPGITSETYSGPILTNAFEGLIRMDDDNQPQPGVAKSWDISDDGLVYTFHLRDAKWATGARLPLGTSSIPSRGSWIPRLHPNSPLWCILTSRMVRNVTKVRQRKRT